VEMSDLEVGRRLKNIEEHPTGIEQMVENQS
jgi:DNA-binding FrmR family transcriptional regulator